MHVDERRNVSVAASRTSGTRGAGAFTPARYRRVGIAVSTVGTSVTTIVAHNGSDPRKHANGRGRSLRETCTCSECGVRTAGRNTRASRSRPSAECGRLVPCLLRPPAESRRPAPLTPGGHRLSRAGQGNTQCTGVARVRHGLPAGGHRCSAPAGRAVRTGNRTHEASTADRADHPASTRGSLATSRAAQGIGRRTP